MSPNEERIGRWVLGLCAAGAALAGTVMAFRTLTGQGALPCAVAMILFWLMGAVLLVRRPLFRSGARTVCALAGLYLALCLRLCLFDHISPDYVSFLGPWTEEMRGMTVRQALTTPIGDYNMPYLYLLLLISRLPVYDLYAIKLVSILADVLLAVAAGRLAALETKREDVILLSFLAALLAPTVWLNSAYWGQCDGVYACFALWGLYCGLKKRPVGCMILLACSFSFKLQAVFLLPVAAFLLVRGELKLRHLPVFPATFLAASLPALLAGRSLSDTFGIYVGQTRAYPYLSLNAPSFWSLIPNDYYAGFASASVLLAGIGVLLLLYLFLGRCGRMDESGLLTVSLILCLAMPWLLPKMHERYFYLAEILSILYAARYPRRWPAALVLLGGGFLIYCSYLFGGMRILSNELVAATYGVTLCDLTTTTLRSLNRRRSAKKEEPSHEQI